MPNADIETQNTSLHSVPGIQVVAVPGPDVKEYYITSQLGGNGLSRLRAETVSALLHDADASVTCQQVFGPREIAPPASTAWAHTWLLGNGGFDQSAASVQTYAIAGSTVTPIQIDGDVVGAVYDDADAVYCQLCGLRPTALEASQPDQDRELFDRIEQALQAAGMSVLDVVRTWFFVDRILEWYDKFNAVRTRFFLDHGVFDDVVPASTGVGMANAAGAALDIDVFAVRSKRMGMTPEKSGVSVEEVPSPLQCSALDYKSSFTRALELHVHSQRRLFISGTASATPDGESAHFGDVDK
jgi:enamine deaminase RidA (YjgF/YER057c/UK114 family)